MLKNSSILITGGTGTFGKSFVPMTLKKYNPRRLVIFSRDEMKQWEMSKIYGSDPRIRFFLGDVRDKERLSRALDGIEYVVHAAAMKIVPLAEYNPFECIKTNIIGSMNLIETCIDCNIKKVIALSTDKASRPVNLYGATKLAADKLFVSGNAYSRDCLFSVVRYGNVMGSRGSVIPYFINESKKGSLPITDRRMTRFMITAEEGVKLVWDAFKDMLGGEIYIRKIPSMNIMDIANVISSSAKIIDVGIRPGEKLHEEMISIEDSHYTYEYKNYFKILSAINGKEINSKQIKNGTKVKEGFVYNSEENNEWMTQKDLSLWIKQNKDKLV